ncbi:MAG: hypothetical protein WKF37_19550 [Bryobacteraceae bacterium]
MNRRQFLSSSILGGSALLPALAFQAEKSKMKITSVRLVNVKQRKPAPEYKPTPGSWSTGGVEVANPMSIYPEYKAERSLFMSSDPAMGGFTVEVATDKGLKGYGRGGPAGGFIVEKHLTKLLLNEDPFIERIWDIIGVDHALRPGGGCN